MHGCEPKAKIRADTYTLAARRSALELVQAIFHNEALLKLGFAFLGDLEKLFKDYGCCYSLLRPFVDVQTPLVSTPHVHTPLASHSSHPHLVPHSVLPAQAHQHAPPLTLAQDEPARAGRGAGSSGVGSSGVGNMSLQALVACELGRKLVKTERMSNWHARPLSPPQLRSYLSPTALNPVSSGVCID